MEAPDGMLIGARSVQRPMLKILCGNCGKEQAAIAPVRPQQEMK
jgi:hypothetical protein